MSSDTCRQLLGDGATRTGRRQAHTLFIRICLARLANTNSTASITFDLPLPFGPTTEEKDWAPTRVRGPHDVPGIGPEQGGMRCNAHRMERPDDLDAGVRLEVLCDQLPDDEPGLRCAAASIATALRGLHHYAPRQNSSVDDAWFVGECGGALAQRWPVWGFELPLLGGEEGRAL